VAKVLKKINDQIKLIHHKKSNKHDATVDALKARKRIEFLQSDDCKRTKRSYEKKKDLYWENDIFKNRAAKKARILCEMEEINSRCSDSNDLCESTVTPDYKCMSLNELKNLIKKRGIKTKARKKEKLIQLLEQN